MGAVWRGEVLGSLSLLAGQALGQRCVRPRARHDGAAGVFEEHGPAAAFAAHRLARAYLRPGVAVPRLEVGHTQRAVAAADHLAADVATVVALHVRNDGRSREAMVPARHICASYALARRTGGRMQIFGTWRPISQAS